MIMCIVVCLRIKQKRIDIENIGFMLEEENSQHITFKKIGELWKQKEKEIVFVFVLMGCSLLSNSLRPFF